MPTDPGLNNDSCIFHGTLDRAGNVVPPSPFWLSDDIQGVNAMGNADPAYLANPLQPGSHTVQVTTHRKADNCRSPTTASGAIVELYLCIPGPVMDPTNSSVVASLGSQFVPYGALVPGGAANSNFPVNIANTGSGPLSPGHKCLVARSYPDDGVTADGSRLAYLPDDQHYAQRNLCIIRCESPCGTTLQTANLNRVEAEPVLLRVIADLNPNKFVVQTVLASLKQIKGFKQLVTNAPPPPFKLILPDFPNAKIRDKTQPSEKGWFGRFKSPNFEAQFDLKPKQTTLFRFETDLAKTNFGNAHIYHLQHLDKNKTVLGGVTLVAVRVKRRP